MAYVPYSPQLGAPYTITSPAGIIADLNNPASANFAGIVSDISGLDGAEVRESAEDLTQADGGQHGDFYFGRRPITMTVRFVNFASGNARDAGIDRLRRATKAMRGDAVLKWTNVGSGGLFTPAAMQTWVRRQQPFRVTGNYAKEVQLALVSEYASLYSQTSHTLAGTSSVAAENQGDAESFPLLRVTVTSGTSVNPVIYGPNGTQVSTFNPAGGNLVISAGHWIEFDTLNRVAYFDTGASANSNILYSGSTVPWPYLEGATTSTFNLAGGGNLSVTWRDAWS